MKKKSDGEREIGTMVREDFIANESLFPPMDRRHRHRFPAPACLRDKSFGGVCGRDEVLESTKKEGSKKRRDKGQAGRVEQL